MISISELLNALQLHSGFFKYQPLPASFCLFSTFSLYSTKFDYKSIGVLGDRSKDRRMVGAAESTEQWRLRLLMNA